MLTTRTKKKSEWGSAEMAEKGLVWAYSCIEWSLVTAGPEELVANQKKQITDRGGDPQRVDYWIHTLFNSQIG